MYGLHTGKCVKVFGIQADLDESAQQKLLQEVAPVFTVEDNDQSFLKVKNHLTLQ